MFVTKQGGNFVFESYSEISSANQPNKYGKITLSVPAELVRTVDCNAKRTFMFSDYETPFGEFTNVIARHVFRRGWRQHRFGVMPGKYYYENDGLHFDATVFPIEEEAMSILFYADANVKSFIGVQSPLKMTIGFNFDKSNIYGLIMPIDETIGIGDIFPNKGIAGIQKILETSYRSLH